MIDHISISISDFSISKRFYITALAPLGLHVVGEDDGWIGFGKNQQGVFWFGVGRIGSVARQSTFLFAMLSSVWREDLFQLHLYQRHHLRGCRGGLE